MDPDLTSMILFKPMKKIGINNGANRVFGIRVVLGLGISQYH